MNYIKCAVYLSSSVILTFFSLSQAVLGQESSARVVENSNFSLQKQPKELIDSRDLPSRLLTEELPEKSPSRLSEVELFIPSVRATDLLEGQDRNQTFITAQESEEKQESEEEVEEEDPRKAADASGRRLSNNYSYFAIGGNTGLTGDGSGVSEIGFSTLGKAGFSENLSLHSAGVLFTERGASLTALTYEFPIRSETEAVVFSPFLGGGIIYRDLFNEDFSIGGVIMGGVDVPISYSFVFTSRINVAFIRDSTDTSISFGIGYIYTKGLLGLIFD
ncbi:MAG: hypothetical protein ACRC8A_05090 [Microcoleaceae cyanobacterium]